MNFSILKNNWKKSAVISLIVAYGTYSFKSYYEIQSHMQKTCHKAAQYADSKKHSRRVLVIINPKANNNKSEENYKKFCEPILHSAGFTVDSMKTSYVGHAKAYIEKNDKLPDVIVVAGGDGTASEVVTGLMRRGSSSCPLALLPMGRKNDASLFFGYVDYIKLLTNSVLVILNGTLKPENVVKYESLVNSDEGLKINKPIYGLNSFSWGVVRDLDSIKDKYWYFGNFKRQAAALFNAFSDDLSWKCSANLTYTPPCDGCSNCCGKEQEFVSTNNWMGFLRNETSEKLYSKSNIKNLNCTRASVCNINTSQLTITPSTNSKQCCELVTKLYKTLEPGLHFIMNCTSSINCLENSPSSTFNCRTITITPTTPCQNKCYSIDGEEYEVRTIEITLIPEAIKTFKPI